MTNPIRNHCVTAHRRLITAATLLMMCAFSLRISAGTPPPISPLPSESHIEWHKRELLLFIHFGLKTFCTNTVSLCDASLFDPDSLDVTHWIDVARDGGFRGIILVAKHDDGFCLWQTSTTDYGVASSPWKNGDGDIVGELANAAHEAGMWFGVYISCWDRHFLESGRKAREYANYFATQWRECLSNYGKIDEVWFDGNNSGKMFIAEEYITLGQRVAEHIIQCRTGGRWKMVASGKTIGYRRIHRLDTPLTGSAFRLVIKSSRALPCISGFSVIGTAKEPSVSCNEKGLQQAPAPVNGAIHAPRRGIHIGIPGERTDPYADDLNGSAALRLDGRVVGPAQKILYMQHGAQYRRHVAPGLCIEKKR